MLIDQTNYQGKYKVWQICENGYIDGINTYVDNCRNQRIPFRGVR